MLNETQRERLRRAGERFRAAQREQNEASAELRSALAEADGNASPEEAAYLTGLDASISAVLLGHK